MPVLVGIGAVLFMWLVIDYASQPTLQELEEETDFSDEKESQFDRDIGIANTEITEEELQDMWEEQLVAVGDNTVEDYLEYVESKQ